MKDYSQINKGRKIRRELVRALYGALSPFGPCNKQVSWALGCERTILVGYQVVIL
jgi:hypothetical protein